MDPEVESGQIHDSVWRATAAFAATAGADLVDPLFQPALDRARRHAGLPVDPDAIVLTWARGGTRETGAIRYRWPIDPKFALVLPPLLGDRTTWVPWRPRDVAAAADRPEMLDRLVERLLTPLIIADSLEFLSEMAERQDDIGDLARAFIKEAMPKARRDAAGWVQEIQAWADTWALMAIARRPRALLRLHPFAVAIAEAYAEQADAAGGVVLGTRYPHHQMQLVSATAQLATGLVALGMHPKLTGQLVGWLGRQRRHDGGFSDMGGPSDAVTSLVAGRLLSTLDPGFDPIPTATWLVEHQRADGWWRALGPEATWLSVEIVDWLRSVPQPFAERFEWPHVALTDRDRRTGLPFFGYYSDFARLCAEVEALSGADVEVAFIDLAGFGLFNNAFGMDMGDQVLRAFAQVLDGVDLSIAIRDGGDEFIVLGPPTGTRLADRLAAFRASWPAACAARFGETSPVAPRILTTTTAGGTLIAARNMLGIEIARLKDAYPTLGWEGVQVVMDRPGASGSRSRGK
jgi:GGDEF domain-containing protein